MDNRQVTVTPTRVESSFTSVSWIPSEAIEGLASLPFELGVGRYDDPPPDVIDDLEALHAAGAFRFANRLRAWIDVADGEVVGHGHRGRSYLSRTLIGLGRLRVAFLPTAFPDLRPEPDVGATSVRFVQTAGGRPGVPAPRVVRDRPFFQWVGPTVWTTLALSVNADGTSHGEMIGASSFPRHWLYDDTGALVAKSAVIDFDEWYRGAFGAHSPWGNEDTPAFVAMAESALERQLSTTIMRGGTEPRLRAVPAGSVLVEQGTPGRSLYLLLDGMIGVDVDGERVAEIGPGAIAGERSILEGGTRTATLTAITDCRVAEANAGAVDRDALAELARGHRREEPDQ
jgi:Cyclic nucleotide-binding domain